MPERYLVSTTAHFDRLAKRLGKRHPKDFIAALTKVVGLLEHDPQNISRRHAIKKLTDVKPGDGQYRIRVGRFRFRYDVAGNEVALLRCGLRREDTY